MSEERKLPDPSVIKEEILAKYPPKIARKRAQSMVVVDHKLDQEVQSNVRTIPGVNARGISAVSIRSFQVVRWTHCGCDSRAEANDSYSMSSPRKG